MPGVSRVEDVVHVVVAKPVAWMLYALWMMLGIMGSAVARCGEWLSRRYGRSARKA